MNIAHNVREVKEEIKSLKDKYHIPYDINICAATKYVGVPEIKELLNAGIKHIGENRVEAFLEKEEAIQDDAIKWHFIGTLQSRKVKHMINKIDYLHSLDRDSLAKEINKHRDKVLECFVEVNCSYEESKHGLLPNEVKSFIQKLEKYDKISIIGLMTMAENTDDEATLHQTFKRLKMIQEEIKALKLPYAPCNQLSMGMSNDYQIAILEGATIVRIGSRLFK